MKTHTLPALNMPWGIQIMLNAMLANPRCTSDHILLCADALDEAIKILPGESHFLPAMRATSADLREIAPLYAHPRGKPHGDFEGTLTTQP
jgi:hypothetical protein